MGMHILTHRILLDRAGPGHWICREQDLVNAHDVGVSLGIRVGPCRCTDWRPGRQIRTGYEIIVHV
jgi:hypothetical protein